MTARSSLACVDAPMYCVNQRMTLGRKYMKIPATAGGRKPDTMAKVTGEDSVQLSKNPMYPVLLNYLR